MQRKVSQQKKCDESKPSCQNCINNKLECKGYGIRLLFDFEDHKYKGFKRIENGVVKYGFTGRPKWKNIVTSNDNKNKIILQNDINSNNTPTKNNNQKIKPQKEIKMFNNFTNTMRAKYYEKAIQNTYTKKEFKQGSKLSFKLESKDKKFDETNMNQLNHSNSKSISSHGPEIQYHHPISSTDNGQSNIDLSDEKFYDALFESLQLFLPGLNTSNSEFTFQDEEQAVKYKNSSPGIIDNGIEITVPNENINNDNNNYSKNQILINKILNHFHLKLMPRISANPNSLWPELAIKYCGFEIAKSCFISLSGLHLVSKEITGSNNNDNNNNNNNNNFEKNEILEKSAFHINKILEYLIEIFQEKQVIEKLNKNDNDDKRNNIFVKLTTNYHSAYNDDDDKFKNTEISTKDSFILILLIYVQVLYGILESGRSAISRFLFKSFARIVRLKKFESFAKNHQSLCMVISLSWWDTIAAITSPDCRLPYCDSNWYGFKDSKNLKKLSTETMSGCPGEIFVCMYNICELRNKMKYNKIKDPIEIYTIFKDIEQILLQYRNYVSYDIELPYDKEVVDTRNIKKKLTKEEYFIVRLKIAKCWMLAVYTKLIDTVKPENHKQQMSQLVLEYLDTYSQIDPDLHILGQMVWPMLQIGSLITETAQMIQLRSYSKVLFETVSALNIQTLQELNESVWVSGSSLEDILSGKEWLQAGIDFLPL
ncbi:hypothetical protein B5S28_g1467 [[Candida] boidinii]|nr:hypothetical protein B5S28_g1467 [[Candida] boidinii]